MEAMKRRKMLGHLWRLAALAPLGALVARARLGSQEDSPTGEQSVARCGRCSSLPGCSLPDGESARRFLGRPAGRVKGGARPLCGGKAAQP